MLQSFRGTIDINGLLSLRCEEVGTQPATDPRIGEFWVVLNSEELPFIRAAIRAGQRRQALQLVCERAHSLGSILRSV